MLSLCVCVGGAGGGGTEGGVRHRKQEPHTKMWGKNNVNTLNMGNRKGLVSVVFRSSSICDV